MSNPPRSTPPRFTSEVVTDPAEIAASEERSRNYRKTAAGKVGTWMVVDAPLPLLAGYIAELPAGERQVFFDELVARLPPDVLRPLAEALHSRASANGAEGQKPAVDGVAG